ncbi:26459_t:CDS:2, partial [Gigaspora margarita]
MREANRYRRLVITSNRQKLTRITQEENEEEILGNRRKHKLILEVAKSEQKNQLVVEDWLPLQRSQLQNIQPKQKEGEEM